MYFPTNAFATMDQWMLPTRAYYFAPDIQKRNTTTILRPHIASKAHSQQSKFVKVSPDMVNEVQSQSAADVCCW